MKHLLFMVLFSMASLVAATDSFQPQIIKGRIIEKGSGRPVSNATLQIRYFSEVAADWEMMVSNNYYNCSDDGDFTITNLLDQVTRCEVELADNNKYQESSISGSFEPGLTDWGTFEVSVRPFYFENCYQQSNLVSATVVNTTRKKAYMRFWLTGKLTRIDDSKYFGCNSEILLKLRKNKKAPTTDYATYLLVPGENDIKLRVKDYGPSILVSTITINGGHSYSEPMMPSSRYVLNLISLPPIYITNPPPIYVTNLPPIYITNLPPILIPFPTNIPPHLCVFSAGFL